MAFRNGGMAQSCRFSKPSGCFPSLIFVPNFCERVQHGQWIEPQLVGDRLHRLRWQAASALADSREAEWIEASRCGEVLLVEFFEIDKCANVHRLDINSHICFSKGLALFGCARYLGWRKQEEIK
ncbi:MAG: hypothetical protein M3N50_01615 [Pseudomonadota bacterium]|nr:hypothetical protein [Pseudomonadota bacterium]